MKSLSLYFGCSLTLLRYSTSQPQSASSSVIWLLSVVGLTSESSIIRLVGRREWGGIQADPWRDVVPPSVALGSIHTCQSPTKTHCLAVHDYRISCQSWAVLWPALSLFLIHPIVGREGTTESDSRSGTQPQRNSKGFGFSF